MRKTHKKKNKRSDDFAKLYSRLKPFYERAKKGKAERGYHFQNCIRASFAKTYEFNVLANNTNQRQNAFFLNAGLRSICEDLILLRYLGALGEVNRDEFIEMSMWHEVLTNLRDQKHFFSENRAVQIVLNPPKDFEVEIEKSVAKLQNFWKQRGWKLTEKNTMPQIRQLAERRGIETLYDFIYRLTCDVVHFNPQVLLRSGWGPLPEVEFSTENFDPYYRAFAVVYGSLLFSLYFKLLKQFLRPSATALKLVRQIEQSLHSTNRWPELVTFEEMNVKPPSPILHVLHRVIAEKDGRYDRTRLLRLRPKNEPPLTQPASASSPKTSN